MIFLKVWTQNSVDGLIEWSRNRFRILICIAFQRKCFTIIDLNVVAASCPVGFTGKYCEKQCSYPHYGIGCQQSCSCSKRHCNVSTGCQFTNTGIWQIKKETTYWRHKHRWMLIYICSSYIKDLYYLFV